MPYITARRGWKGLGATTPTTQAQWNALSAAEKQAYLQAVAMGINIAVTPLSSVGAGAGATTAATLAPYYASGALTPVQGGYATVKDGTIQWGQVFSSQSAPIKTTSTPSASGTTSSGSKIDFSALTNLAKNLLQTPQGQAPAYTGPVVAPNLLAQMQPPQQSGLPSWVLPVGLGVAALGVVLFLVARKR